MERNVNEHTEVIVMPFEKQFKVDTKKVINIVREKLLFSTDTPYAQARVEVVYDTPGTPDHLIVTLAHRHLFKANLVKIALGDNYSVTSIDRDYRG